MSYPSLFARCFLVLWCTIQLTETALAQAEKQPLAVTKLSRLLYAPTIPVSTNAGDLVALLDTGATGVALDPLIAQVLGADNLEIAERTKDVSLAFDVRIGELQGKVTRVTLFDFRPLREHSPQPILGLIGMSVLNAACIRCDFDGEQLSLLAKSTPSQSESTDLFFAEGGRPHVIMSIGRQSFPVMIDLGSEFGLKVPSKVYDSLESPVLRTIQPAMTANGIRQSRGHKQATVKVGPLQIADALVQSTDDDYGLAGLTFLCRLNLELDFPAKRMHFQPSKRFAARDNQVRFGLSAAEYFGPEGGITDAVAFVAKGSAAEAAGIRPGVLLLSAKSEFYGQHRGADLYRMLGLPRLGPTTLDVLREGKTLKFNFE